MSADEKGLPERTRMQLRSLDDEGPVEVQVESPLGRVAFTVPLEGLQTLIDGMGLALKKMVPPTAQARPAVVQKDEILLWTPSLGRPTHVQVTGFKGLRPGFAHVMVLETGMRTQAPFKELSRPVTAQ